MALVVANVGELLMLDKMLSDSAEENLSLKLYKTDVTPTQSSVAGDFTEADFTSYAAKTLTNASWAAASTVSNKASSAYATQTWSCGATGNTIYGYYVVGATSGTLYWAEKFGTARVLVDTDELNVTPVLTLNSEA